MAKKLTVNDKQWRLEMVSIIDNILERILF